jgi:hypothetical protein
VAIAAPDYAFIDLGFDNFKRRAPYTQLADSQPLSTSYVIELKDNWI